MAATRGEWTDNQLLQISTAVDRIDGTTRRLAENLARLASGAPSGGLEEYEGLLEALWEPDFVLPANNERIANFLNSRNQDEVIDRVLRDLRFREIGQRKDAIPEAYQKTFEWTFHDGDSSDRRPTGFSTWLERDSKPLFWVTGNPGSGKSTLMKYISEHELTKEKLRTWAKGLPLVVASFYFWAFGPGGTEVPGGPHKEPSPPVPRPETRFDASRRP